MAVALSKTVKDFGMGRNEQKNRGLKAIDSETLGSEPRVLQ
jgi:hypothetical protein